MLSENRKNIIKQFLDEKLTQYNRPEFIENDPISIPHLFSQKEDIEIAGFLTAIIAWGQRITIIKNAKKLIEMMEYRPYQFIMHFSEKDVAPFRKFSHRTFNGEDCEYFLWALKAIYQEFGDLENAFTDPTVREEKDTFHSIMRFRNRFLKQNPQARTSRHVPNPAANSSAKRINMFLRWMVRKDDHGVDFGLWNKLRSDQLICPLDIHTGNVARKLGLLSRPTNDWKAALELTELLREFDPGDPVKYDIVLFGLGIHKEI